MAIGDTLTAPYQFELDETNLYGTGNGGLDLDLAGASSFSGIGRADAKTQDVVFNFGDGSYGNPDYKAVRVFSIPVLFRSGTLAGNDIGQSFVDFHNFLNIWTEQPSDLSLAISLPGLSFWVMGRPRACKEDLSLLRYGVIRALLRFDALDPHITVL